MRKEEVDTDVLADTIVATVSCLEDVFPHGTVEEKKELIALFVDKIELDSVTRAGKVYMKRFPIPENGTGKSFGVCSGGPLCTSDLRAMSSSRVNDRREPQGTIQI